MFNEKYYVVWKGKRPGIYISWDECKKQIEYFPNPQFKLFGNRDQAEKAFKYGAWMYYKRRAERRQRALKMVGNPITASLVVDGTFDPITREIQYRCINLETSEIVFEKGPFAEGTINIAEFLAVAETLIYCKQNELSLPIYTNSITAISWIKDKEMRTKVQWNDSNTALRSHSSEILRKLRTRRYDNPIFKWQTSIWGVNPADYGKRYDSDLLKFQSTNNSEKSN